MAVNDKQAPCQVKETKSTAMQSYLVNAGVFLYCCILEKKRKERILDKRPTRGFFLSFVRLHLWNCAPPGVARPLGILDGRRSVARQTSIRAL